MTRESSDSRPFLLDFVQQHRIVVTSFERATMSSLVRQWNLLAALSARQSGTTVAALAIEHGVGQKTIRRDLLALKGAGFPLFETFGDHARKEWRLAPDAAIPPLSINWMEDISLYLARQFLTPLAGTYFWTSASRVFDRPRATLG